MSNRQYNKIFIHRNPIYPTSGGVTDYDYAITVTEVQINNQQITVPHTNFFGDKHTASNGLPRDAITNGNTTYTNWDTSTFHSGGFCFGYCWITFDSPLEFDDLNNIRIYSIYQSDYYRMYYRVLLYLNEDLVATGYNETVSNTGDVFNAYSDISFDEYQPQTMTKDERVYLSTKATNANNIGGDTYFEPLRISEEPIDISSDLIHVADGTDDVSIRNIQQNVPGTIGLDGSPYVNGAPLYYINIGRVSLPTQGSFIDYVTQLSTSEWYQPIIMGWHVNSTTAQLSEFKSIDSGGIWHIRFKQVGTATNGYCQFLAIRKT